MPELKTEQTTTHTLTLTSAELTALRNAACIALDPNARAAFDERHGHPDWYGSPDPEAWRAFARLGLPPTRGDAEYTNPSLIGRMIGV
jgi:hypothetical protein